MAYVSFSDFRTATLAEYCYGLDLTITEAPDAALTSAITSISQRIDNLTNDHFESESLTYNLDVDFTSSRLYLPKRVRSVSAISTRIFDGTLTVESSTAYRMFSSLTPAGDLRIASDGLDRVETISSGVPLSTGSCYWPVGPQTVQVVGTFSWAVTPGDIKYAVSRLVYAKFKESRADLDRAETLTNAGVTLRFLETDADHPTGIREVDEILTDYSRDAFIGIG
jgi:hypothetical protein